MPIYDFCCTQCGVKEEKILKISERDKEVICSQCHIVMRRAVSLPAKTATLWNDGWNSGLSGQGIYSHALGKKVHSRREEENIMKAKGFVGEKDLAPHWWEDQQEKKRQKLAEQDKLTETYNSKVSEYGGDKIRAMTETFTTEACLDGSLIKTFDEKITI